MKQRACLSWIVRPFCLTFLVMGAVFSAGEVFAQCGDPAAGDCFSANGTPFCNDAACCNTVCAADSFCCNTQWDSICAGEANQMCGGGAGCAPSCGKQNVECLVGSPEYDSRLVVGQLMSGGSPICTAWMIAGPNIVMTNWHCVQGSIAGLTVRFNFECDACTGGAPKVTDSYTVTQLIHEDQSLDYALLGLSGNPAAVWGVAQVDSTFPVVGTALYEIHHGEGKVKGISTGQITSIDIPGTCIAGTTAEIGVSAPATGGASGSPIFSTLTNCVIGICHCGPACAPGWGIPMSHILPAATPFILAAGGTLNVCGGPPPTGACCFPDGSCVSLTAADCGGQGGVYGGDGIACAAANCPQPCVGDVTPVGGNGVVNIDDLVSILNSFGPCVGCPQDITPAGGNGVVNIDDLVAVLNAFGPCP